MRALVLFAIAGCARPIAIRAPTGAGALTPEWVVTHPHLTGTPYVATAGDDIYAVSCETPTLQKIGGDVAWTAALGPTCYVGEHGLPIAASDRGVVVAFAGNAGIRIVAFGRDGKLRWQRTIPGDQRQLAVAAHGERAALCLTVGDTPPVIDGAPIAASFGTMVALVFDARGAVVETHAIEQAFDPVACSFDRDGALWAVTRLGNRSRVDGRGRALADATYAVRLTAGTRVVRLFSSASTWATAMPDGFAYVTYDQDVAFVDRDGKQRWRLAVVGRGCSLSISPIAAAPDRLLAGLHVFCGQRHGSVQLGDLSLVDQTDPEADLAEGTVVVAFDPVAGKTRAAYRIDRSALGMTYLPTAEGFVLTSWFSGDLGLGTRFRSNPDEYSCLSNLPMDAQTWSSYETDRPSCRSGFHLETRQPQWPFVARFVLPAR